MTARIFFKLILGIFGMLLIALAAVDLFSSRVIRETYIDLLKRQLLEKGKVLASAEDGKLKTLSATNIAQLAKASATRITVVDASGKVLSDSDADASRMENHSYRPEFKNALKGEMGFDVRRSKSLGQDFLYVALPLEAGAFRLSVPLREIDGEVASIRKRLLFSVFLAFVPAVLIATFFARRASWRLARIIEFAGTLAQGKFSARMPDGPHDELGTLSSKLNETAEKLQHMFEELQHEHAELAKMERIRKDFVINVSHELRTPLASIQGYTETLLDGALHDPDHNLRFLNIIRSNAERLARLTSDLLTLSRIELRTQRFQFASYYVNVLLQDCVDSMLPLAEKKRISIRLQPAPDGTEVVCDSEAVHQILSNLIDNALKYTPEEGHIVVSAATHENTGGIDEVEIAVRDTGIGIPAEDLPRLFERFYRVDKARSRELGGTGLGLAIVKHLVRAQGGDVKVTSELNHGSIFSFTLPAQDLGLEINGLQGEVMVP